MDEDEHNRKFILIKTRNGWRFPVLDPSHTANFQYNNISTCLNSDHIVSMVSSECTRLVRARTRSFSSYAGKKYIIYYDCSEQK